MPAGRVSDRRVKYALRMPLADATCWHAVETLDEFRYQMIRSGR